MYKAFQHFDDLKHTVEEDKLAKGVGAATLDRYPIRFVLFDNFRECYEFVEYLQGECGAHVESVDHWIDSEYPDLIITHVELAERISDHIRKMQPNDCVIAPFSELARFYDNQGMKAFDALLKTIKAIQASPKGVENHQRVYIPIVGLEGKMETFNADSQAIIWRLISEDKDLTYRLILTPDKDYGVKGLKESYTIIHNIREWLNIWKDAKQQVSPQMICLSNSIYANAEYAQPDNAFSYVICNTAYEFLVDGLQLSFGTIEPQMNDGDNWDELASQIDISSGFNFKTFVQRHFGINDVEDHRDFIRLWFSHPHVFDRWLLSRYYADKNHGQGYLCKVLNMTSNFGTMEFIENMVGTINEIEQDIRIRHFCLQFARDQHVQLSEAAENQVSKLLQLLPEKMGYQSTLRYFTGISKKEKETAIRWLGQGVISPGDVKAFYPDLYYYLKDGIGITVGVPEWLESYFAEYKRAKISNRYTNEIKEHILQLNANESQFDTWYNSFATTYTLLQKRGDIEVFFWIDGLGVEWIPLVKEIIAEKSEQKIYLNEIQVARAKLPTTTSNNKTDLQRLLPEGVSLEKSGDLDTLAHRTDNVSPFTVIKEVESVRKTLEDILNKFIGKKIAIISDHGLTYLSQLVQGKNMVGVESDHHGRLAIRESESNAMDSSYFRLEDNRTLCALRHESLCSKVPNNQGAHGGCTPEEVLVPIFVISSSPAPTNWNAELLTKDVSGSTPRAQFIIKNIPSTDIPYVTYNNRKYKLHDLGNDIYETEDMILDSNAALIILTIGAISHDFHIHVSTGVQEDDLFDM